MMKKLAIAVLAVAVVGLVAVAVAVAVGALFHPADSYEIQQAKQAATLAEIARNQQSAQFWSNFMQIGVLAVAGLVGLVVMFGVWWLATSRAHQQKVELLRLKRNWNLIEPDANGNFPAYAHRASGELIRLEPGNSPFAPQYINGLQPQPLQRTGPGRVITVSANRQPIAAYAVSETELPARSEPLQISEPESRKFDVSRESEANLQVSGVSDAENFRDLMPELVAALREGRGKTETLKGLGLVGRKYSQASKLWEEIKAQSELSRISTDSRDDS